MVNEGCSGLLPEIPMISGENVVFPFAVDRSQITSSIVSFASTLQYAHKQSNEYKKDHV